MATNIETSGPTVCFVTIILLLSDINVIVIAVGVIFFFKLFFLTTIFVKYYTITNKLRILIYTSMTPFSEAQTLSTCASTF
jgi:hypothetical protein